MQNVAIPAKRLIRIVCPTVNGYCIAPGSGQASCLSDGVCGVFLPSLSSQIGAGATNATPPTILLNGSPMMTMTQSTAGTTTASAGYDTCSPTQSVQAVCDRGATATDAVDGVITNAIRVCGFPTTRDPTIKNPKPLPTVAVACKINTFVPGYYNITYSVTNSAGLTASVNRTLFVQSVCPSGQTLCSDQVSYHLDEREVHQLNSKQSTVANQ